jgi:hypothetical protein
MDCSLNVTSLLVVNFLALGSIAGSSSNTTSLPDHDYNIYRVNKKTKAVVVNVNEETTVLQDEQMEAVAQSVAAAAQEKEKLKRKRGGQAVRKID